MNFYLQYLIKKYVFFKKLEYLINNKSILMNIYFNKLILHKKTKENIDFFI